MASSANNASVYGGDEINALVLDPGSLNTRIGYAGDDFPKVVTPSYYAARSESALEEDGKSHRKRIFGESINVPRSNYDVKPILKDSMIIDWDAAIDQYSYYFHDFLKIEQKEQPILITEPVWTPFDYRRTMVENFFEKFDFPALYLARSPTCISFQQGRPNCLVVDIGHEAVSVTPVIDGITLMKNSTRTNYGGQFLSDQIADTLKVKFPGLSVESSYKIKEKKTTVFPEKAIFKLKDVPQNLTVSYEDLQREKIWHEFKETVLEAPEKKITGSNRDTYTSDAHKRQFEFPTGQSLELSAERFELADALFEPQSYEFSTDELKAKYPPNNGVLNLKSLYDDYKPLKRARKADSNQSTPPPSDNNSIRGLTSLISYTLSTIDIDLRSAVAHNIIITGGVSLISQLTERLYNELSNQNPGLKIRLHAVGNSTERMNQAWIGGSVLSSLGTFHQMWVSKAEYEEAGANRILNQRFR